MEQGKSHMRYVVGVGDMKIAEKGDLIVTHALGSCLGLMVHDPGLNVGGLLHAMLPLQPLGEETHKHNHVPPRPALLRPKVPTNGQGATLN